MVQSTHTYNKLITYTYLYKATEVISLSKGLLCNKEKCKIMCKYPINGRFKGSWPN